MKFNMIKVLFILLSIISISYQIEKSELKENANRKKV